MDQQPLPGLDMPAAETGKLTREQLERHLWASADILRGSIDSSDYSWVPGHDVAREPRDTEVAR